MGIDFLIIGQGLAGSLLAWELIRRGCSVVVVDNGKENASKIAAGLINPITGMRFVKTDDVDTLLTTATDYYLHLADFFQQQFFIEKPMLRIFRSENEERDAGKRLNNSDYRRYIGDIRTDTNSIAPISALYGFLEQNRTGYLLTRPLLECLKGFFISRNSYRKGDFDYREVILNPTLQWRDIYPGHIIFCEGHRATQNPWFSWLPFKPVKGEILTLEHQSRLPDKILNYGNWLIPLNAHQIRIGATFDRENLNTQPTEKGKNELFEALRQLMPSLVPSALVAHQANIRPSTSDRHPFSRLPPGTGSTCDI